MTKKERNRLICARHEEGYSQEEIGRFYNLSQSAVSLIILNEKRGLNHVGGERRGAKGRLTSSQFEELKNELTRPLEGEEKFKYWNKWSVRELIIAKFGVTYHQNYIWKLMKKIGLSSQLPQKKDYRQNPTKVKNYKGEKIPLIKKSKS